MSRISESNLDDYQGRKVRQPEVAILRELEKMIGQSIPPAKEIEYGTRSRPEKQKFRIFPFMLPIFQIFRPFIARMETVSSHFEL